MTASTTKPNDISIRHAVADDAAAIADIYNEAIRTTTATFDMEPKTAEDRLQWLEAHDDRHPVFVAELNGQVAGWACLTKWSDRPAYYQTAETSFYVGEAFRGRGIGSTLKEWLIAEARRLGFHTLLARAAGESFASIHINESFGFKHIGTMKEVGFKFGRRLDVHAMQLMLDETTSDSDASPDKRAVETSVPIRSAAIGSTNAEIPNSKNLYDDDLAYIHDVGFSGLAESWAPGLLEILRKAGIGEGTIVDLGCGGGGWVEHLVRAGYQAVGVDVSPAMIDLASKRVPSAEFHVDSIWDYSIPHCRAVTALSEVICYRAASTARPNLRSLFRQVFDALEPGGLLIFDVAEVGLNRNWDRTFIEGDDWACLVRYEYDEKRDHLLRHITAFRKVDKSFRRSAERHIVQLYRSKEVAELLRSAGFRVRTVRTFGNARLLPMRVGFVARKPE